MIQLRPFQADLKAAIFERWAAGKRNVLAVSPTGSGKTVLFADILRGYSGASVAIAHRQELVSQISLALARNEVRHGLIAPDPVVRNIVRIHMEEVGRSWFDASARCRVAGVDTMVRMDPKNPWLAQVGLTVQDEAHHVLKENKWGRGALMFPNAYGLGVTATPVRADGKGLGSHADGLFDAMVVGPSMRALIDMGHLTEYRIFAPPSDLDLSGVPLSAGGDFSPKPLSKAVHKSHIVGDIVASYLKIAPGKLGVTFAVDIEHATKIAAAYRAAGVPAEVVTSETPDALRVSIMRRFKARQILQLVNVDLFGEGFDLPAVEVVSMGRPTASFGLYAQQFGRMLRLLLGKLFGILIDHVRNVERHGLPDAPRRWSLDRREKRARSAPDDVMPVRSCLQCTAVYERYHTACPFCGYAPVPSSRGAPEFVDGDLYELSPDVLARMRGEIDVVDQAVRIGRGVPHEAHGAIMRNHNLRYLAQKVLRATMELYGGVRRDLGETDRQAQKRFYLQFGVDVMSAQALNAADANALNEKIRAIL